jgi:hypothetical protein
MKEVPMLFDAESVRGILAGIKTKTRRTQGLEVINECPDHWEIVWQGVEEKSGKWGAHFDQKSCSNFCKAKAGPGFGLWARETFSLEPKRYCGDKVVYRADGKPSRMSWKPSIFMPRKFSRLLLRVTEVRVERVRDISPGDAIAEGLLCDEFPIGGEMVKKYGCAGWQDQWFRQSPVDAYERRWNEVNGKGSWSKNPWVWCYTFERIT